MGPTSDRKTRELAEREQTFLDLALGLLLEQGYVGLTMDKLAAATDYSKGTLYLHFKNKEDVVCALLRRFQLHRLEFFERAASLQLSSRQRITALGLAAEIFVLAFPENARIEPILKAASIRDKASKERCEALDQVEFQCFGMVLEMAQQGLRDGDLTLTQGDLPEHLVMALWSMHVGASLLSNAGGDACPIQGSMPEGGGMQDALYRGGARLLDGYGWRPFAGDFDYPSLRMQLLRTHFSAEARSLGLIE